MLEDDVNKDGRDQGCGPKKGQAQKSEVYGKRRRQEEENGTQCQRGKFSFSGVLAYRPSPTLSSSHISIPQNSAVQERKAWVQNAGIERVCWYIGYEQKDEKQWPAEERP